MGVIKDIVQVEKLAFEYLLKDDDELKQEFQKLTESIKPKIVSISKALSNKVFDKKVDELKNKIKEIESAINKINDTRDFFASVIHNYIKTFEGEYLEFEDIEGKKYIVPSESVRNNINRAELEIAKEYLRDIVGKYTIELTASEYKELIEAINGKVSVELFQKIIGNAKYDVTVTELMYLLKEYEEKGDVRMYEILKGVIDKVIDSKRKATIKVLKNKPKNIETEDIL